MARDLLDGFLDYLRHERRYSDHTVAAYATDLEGFFAFLTTHLGNPPTTDSLARVQATDVTSYLAHGRLRAGLAKSSLNRKLSSIRSFYRFLADRYKIHNDHALRLRGPKSPASVPYALNEPDTQRLLGSLVPRPTDGWVRHRDYTLLLLLYGMGLRISEALGLRWGDVDEVMTIHGKGNKQRRVPLLPAVRTSLTHLKGSLSRTEKTDPLFQSAPGKALTARTVQRLLARLRIELGLSENLTPHALRHCFATHLLAHGADLRTVQELLGHATLSTTQRYLASGMTQILSVHTRAHPLEQLAPPVNQTDEEAQ